MNIGVAHPIIVNPSVAQRPEMKRIESAATAVIAIVFTKPLISCCCNARGSNGWPSEYEIASRNAMCAPYITTAPMVYVATANSLPETTSLPLKSRFHNEP